MILNKHCAKLLKQFRKNNSVVKVPEKILKASYKVKQ